MSSIKKIWILAAVLMALAVLCLLWREGDLRESARGQFVFGQGGERLLLLTSEIEIKTPSSTVTLYKDDGYWRVLEADNYFANIKSMGLLQKEIKRAQRGAPITQENADESWTQLSLYDAQENLLERVQISNAQKNGTHDIRYKDNDKTYLSSWKMRLPPSPNAWTYRPLLSFDGVSVNTMEKDGMLISRQQEGAAFYDTKTNLPYQHFEYLKVFSFLSDISYERVSSAQEFDTERFCHVSKFKVTTFDGLEISFNVYTDYQEYWLQIALDTTSLPRKEVDEYVSSHRFLYEGWWFKLPEEAGRTLFMFQL